MIKMVKKECQALWPQVADMRDLPTILKRTGTWIVVILQMIIGLIVIKTGLELAAGKMYFTSTHDTTLTGIFVTLVGAFFLFTSFLRLMGGQNRKESEDDA